MVIRASEEATAFSPSASQPFGLPKQLERLRLILDPGQIQPVAPDPFVRSDRTGAPHPDGNVLPGPFNHLD